MIRIDALQDLREAKAQPLLPRSAGRHLFHLLRRREGADRLVPLRVRVPADRPRSRESTPTANPDEFPNRDIRVSDQFLRDNEQLLLFLAPALLAAALQNGGRQRLRRSGSTRRADPPTHRPSRAVSITTRDRRTPSPDASTPNSSRASLPIRRPRPSGTQTFSGSLSSSSGWNSSTTTAGAKAGHSCTSWPSTSRSPRPFPLH